MTEAERAIITARTGLIVTNPFFGTLALHLKLVEVGPDKDVYGRKIDTMAVDGINFYFSPEFTLGLKDNERLGVVAHEVLHCAYHHMTRRNHRHPEIWNAAADFRINFDLIKDGFTLPGEPIAWKAKPTKEDMQKRGHLYDKRFAEMTTEQIYDYLIDDLDKAGRLIRVEFGGEGLGTDTKSCGEVIDCPTDQKIEAAKVWGTATQVAVNAAKRQGNVPGSAKRLINDLNKPVVNWREMLRRFIDSQSKDDYSWQRPNRRYISGGLYLPGFIPDSLKQLVMFIDCSGSISDRILKAFMSEVAGALDSGATERVTVAYVDTDVRKVDDFYRGDLVKADTVGGGGTDFRTAMEWVKNNHPDAAAIVFLTDMMTGSFGEDPGIPTMWGNYSPKNILQQYNPPFGEVIHISNDGL